MSHSANHTTAIIGAGSSGLAAAKNFRSTGFSVQVFEGQGDLGGNWNYATPSARIYRSTHTISSKPGTEYPDFPMPSGFPDYPHHSQILAYLRAYADAFALLEHIRFETRVIKVEPTGPDDPKTPWQVTLQDGTTARFDTVVVANGHNWHPKYPDYPGEFSGIAIHSADYKTPELFQGKRVLVIGGGNSGCDIVVEAAQAAGQVYHSTRRGYWYLPKYLLGKPADQVGDAMLALGLPLWLRRATATLTHRLMVGSPRNSRLPKPDHRLFETHPVVNSLLPYYVGHGDIVPKPDVTRFAEKTVQFVDGTSVDVDVVVFATGYQIRFPFMEEHFLNWHDGRPSLYLNVFHPQYDTLFVAGLIQPDSGQFGLVHWQTLAAARYAAATFTGDSGAEPLRRRKADPRDDLGNGIAYKDSSRHYLEVEHWSYQKKLRRWAKRLGTPAGTANPEPSG